MNLFKRTTASVALVALVSGVFSTGVSAYDVAELNAAQALAAKGYINSQSDAAGYALDNTITRAEIAKVAANVAELAAAASCEGKFADVSATTPNDWVCGYVEALLANGLISANANYNPNANLTKAEAVKLMLTVAGEEVSYDAATWQADFVSYAVENGFVSTFSDYNTAATRGFVFSVAAAATTEDEGDDILSELDKLLGGDDEEETTTEEETEEETNVSTGNGSVEVTLSPESPSNGVVAENKPRTAILAFEVAAASEDVTLDEVRLDYTGLSDYNDIDTVKLYNGNDQISKGSGKDYNDKYIEVSFENDVVVKAGETMTIVVTAEVQDSSTNASHQLTLTELTASGDVEMENISSMNFQVVSASNVSELELDIDVVNGSEIQIGEVIELADFELEEKNDNEDVMVKSLTFELAGSMDHEDDISDIVLYVDGEEVASDLMVNDDEEVVVDLDFTIEADEKSTFVLKAVVTGSVSDTLSASLTEVYAVGADTEINSDITGDAYGTTASARTIEGSEINVSFDKSDVDEAKPDAEEVMVGTLNLSTDGEYTVTRVQVTVDTNGGSNVEDIVQKLELDGKGFDADDGNLNTTTGIYYFDDISLNNESLELELTFDVIDNVALNGETVEFTPKIIEVEDEENDENYNDGGTGGNADVNDILSTNALDDNTVTIETAKATFLSTSLNTNELVLGNGVETIGYKGKINIGDADVVTISDMNFTQSGTVTVDLDDVVDSAELNIGGKTFDADIDADSLDFNVNADIEAGSDNVEVLVTLVLKDNDSVLNNQTLFFELDTAALANDVEDSDGNTLGANLVTSTANDNLAVTELLDKGTFDITLQNDVDTDDNLENTVLAGSSNVTLAELEIEADFEDIKVEELTFTIAGDASATLDTVKLVAGSTELATADSIVYDGTTTTTITFDSEFIVADSANQMDVELVASVNDITGVGGETSAVAQDLVVVLGTVDVKGDSSNDDITATTSDEGAETVSIVPTIVTPSMSASLSNTTTPKISFYSDSGNNTDSNEEAIDSVLREITFSTLGSTFSGALVSFELVNEDDSTDIATGVYSGATKTVTFDVTGLSANNKTVEDGKTETFKVVITGTTVDSDTITLTLPKDGVSYDADTSTGITVNLDSEIDFGSRTY